MSAYDDAKKTAKHVYEKARQQFKDADEAYRRAKANAQDLKRQKWEMIERASRDREDEAKQEATEQARMEYLDSQLARDDARKQVKEAWKTYRKIQQDWLHDGDQQ